jgi:hypothetical protein
MGGQSWNAAAFLLAQEALEGPVFPFVPFSAV